MKDLLKKSIYTGLGFALLTKDKVETIVEEFKKETSLSEKQGEELYKKILEKTEENKLDLESEIEKIIISTVDKLGLATKKDIEELKIIIQSDPIQE